MFNNRPPRIDLEELKKLLNSSTNNKQDIKKIEAKQKKILNNIERLIKAYEKLQKGNERVFHKIKLIANLIIVYLSAPIAILAIFFVGGLVTENWLETVLFVLVIITLIGIFPGSYVAYLYYKEKVQLERLRKDLKLLGLFTEEELDEVEKLYNTVYSPPQFAIYITLLVILATLVFGAYYYVNSGGTSNFILIDILGIYYLITEARSNSFIFIDKIGIGIIFFSFLGAYFWGIQLVVRRYNTFDLQPQVYSSIILRALLAAVITFGSASIIREVTIEPPQTGQSLSATQLAKDNNRLTSPSSTGKTVPWQVLAFIIGIFPSQGIRWLNLIASRAFNAPVDQYNERPLRKIVGINTWHEARLLELGIDDAQSLATVDICKILLSTQFDTQQVVNWIDQAILHMKVGTKIDRFLEAKITTFHEFHRALKLSQGSQQESGQQKESPKLDSTISGMLGITTNEVEFLRDYSNYPNYVYIREYYEGIAKVASQQARKGMRDVLKPSIKPIFSMGGQFGQMAQLSEQEQEIIEVEIQQLKSYLEKEYTYFESEYETTISYREIGSYYNGLGYRYYLLGEKDQAIEAYNRAVKLDPKLAQAYSNRSLIYIDQKEYDSAIADGLYATKLDPSSAIAFNNLGLAYGGKKELKLAIDSFDTALRMNPRLAEAYYNRGVVSTEVAKTQKEYEKVAQDFEKAYLLGYEPAALWSWWGLALCNLAKYEDAIDKLNRAIFLVKDIAEIAIAYARRGYSYLQLGSEFYSNANLDFTQATQKDSKLIYAYVNHGLLKAREGKYKEAIEKYNQAIENGDNQYVTYLNLAIAHSRLEEWEQVISNGSQVLEKIEQLENRATETRYIKAETRYHLAYAYQKLGIIDKAIDQLTKAQAELTTIQSELDSNSDLGHKIEELLEALRG